MGRITRAAIVTVCLLALGVVIAPAASAHATFSGGSLTLEEFGLTNEPVTVGDKTAFQFEAVRDGKPVTWTPDELKGIVVHVFVGNVKPSEQVWKAQPGGKPLELPLHATPWVGPGTYESESFALSHQGVYTGHVNSLGKKVGGEVIDVIAPMGEKTYGPVEQLATWPDQLPTTAELAARDQAMTKALAATAATAATAKTEAAETPAAVWLAVGLAAGSLIVGVVALTRGRRQTPTHTRQAELGRDPVGRL